MSIFTRVLIACLLPLVIIFYAIIVSINNVVYDRIVESADDKAAVYATEAANRINQGYQSLRDLVGMVSAHLSGLDPSAPDAEAATADRMRLILRATPYVHNIWFSFEPGEFVSGERFSRDFVRYGDSVVVKTGADEDILGDPDEAPWYYYPYSKRMIWFESVDYYDYEFGDGPQYVGTISMPIVRDGKTVGVIGIDMLYESLFRFIDEKQIENELLILVMAQDGSVVYSAGNEHTSKSVFDMRFEGKDYVRNRLAGNDTAAYGGKHHYGYDRRAPEYAARDTVLNVHGVSPFFGVPSRMSFIPVSGRDSRGRQLYLYVDFTEQALFGDAEKVTGIIVSTGLFGMFLFAFILFITIRAILKPIRKLTESADVVANGNLDLNVDAVFNLDGKLGKDEIYKLFASLKKVIDQLKDAQSSKLEAINARYEQEKAELRSQAKSNFLAKMSHEIRTPMNAITGMAELALREEMSPAVQEHVLTIKQAGANLLSLVNDILDLSKIESGKLEIVPADYQLSSLVNDVISIIRMRVVDSRIRFVVNVDSRIPDMLFGDEIRIRQILLNVLSNAVKYTDKGFISLVIDGKTVDGETAVLKMEVEDSGRGIKKEDMGKLFGDYVQVDLEANKGIEGTGLGLSIAHNLVTDMGGAIDVASEYGRGTKFTVTLPQKIRSPEPLASVDRPEEKSAIVYERRSVYADSMMRTLKNLGIRCKCVKRDEELYGELKSDEYAFVFVESILYRSVRKMLLEFNSRAKVVLLTSFGNAVTEQGMSVISMPAHTISIANILNGADENYSYGARESSIVRFNAPGARVLVVDDINTNLKVAVGLLSPYKMQIDLAMSGAQAIEAVRENRYDVVFMDHMMPEMDGIEAVKRIRDMGGEDQYFSLLPIVALTATAVAGTREMFLANGFNDFISKPIDTVKLNSVLEKWIPTGKKVAAARKIVAKKEAPVDFVIEGVDIGLGVSRTGGTVTGYLRTLAVFCSDGREKSADIKKSLENDNLPLFSTYVHALKSAAANIGAVRLSETAKALEEAGKRADRVYINENTPYVLADLEVILRGAEEILAAKKESLSQEIGVDKKALNAALASLKTAIGDMHPGGINAAVKELHKYEHAADVGGAVESVLQFVLNGGYEEAVAQIDGLLGSIRS